MPENLRSPRDTEMLRSSAVSRPVGVDRANAILKGFVVAQLGPFKSEARGEFDLPALEEIVRLGNASKQLKSRLGHETACDTALGKFLGRPKDFFLSETTNADGKRVPAVRADLHFDKTALEEPIGGGKPLGLYVMDLAESDASALSSSLVLRVKRTHRLNPDGTKQKDDKGEELPPLWMPVRLFGSDIVSVGDAVDGVLSPVGESDGLAWKGAELLDAQFPDETREQLAERLNGWLSRYLDYRFGPDEKSDELASAYGYCPKCGAEGATRERRMGGNDHCKAGCAYPSANALATHPATAPVPAASPVAVPAAPPVAQPAQPPQPSLSLYERRLRQRERESLT